MPLRILCIHQGYERYGSDRAFVERRRGLRGAGPTPRSTWSCPRTGPIVPLLEPSRAALPSSRSSCCAERRSCAHGRHGPRDAAACCRACRRAAQGLRLAYINTSVIIDYALATRLVPGRRCSTSTKFPKARAVLSSDGSRSAAGRG